MNPFLAIFSRLYIVVDYSAANRLGQVRHICSPSDFQHTINIKFNRNPANYFSAVVVVLIQKSDAGNLVGVFGPNFFHNSVQSAVQNLKAKVLLVGS